jgi:hypothetical protein
MTSDPTDLREPYHEYKIVAAQDDFLNGMAAYLYEKMGFGSWDDADWGLRITWRGRASHAIDYLAARVPEDVDAAIERLKDASYSTASAELVATNKEEVATAYAEESAAELALKATIAAATGRGMTVTEEIDDAAAERGYKRWELRWAYDQGMSQKEIDDIWLRQYFSKDRSDFLGDLGKPEILIYVMKDIADFKMAIEAALTPEVPS